LDFTGFIELLLTGAAAGLMAGFFGVGGGFIITPLCLLVYPALGIDNGNLIKIIFGTNMFVVTAFSVSAVIMHAKKGNVLWKIVLIIAPLAVLGSLAGSLLASHTDSSSLKKAFAVFLLLAAAITFKNRKGEVDGSGIIARPLLTEKYLPALGGLAGFLGSFLGIGGGIVMISPMILLFGLPIKKVAGTSSAVIIFIGITATIGYMFFGPDLEIPGLSTGYVWWSAALPLVIGGVPMARFGALMNSKTHGDVLKILFCVIIFAIGLKLLLF
jgi:uncharacterized protein